MFSLHRRKSAETEREIAPGCGHKPASLGVWSLSLQAFETSLRWLLDKSPAVFLFEDRIYKIFDSFKKLFWSRLSDDLKSMELFVIVLVPSNMFRKF